MTLRRGRRGFSIVEAVVVTTLVSTVAAASLVWFSAASQPDTDTAAKAALVAFTEAQNQAFREGSAVLTASDLASRDFAHTYVTTSSTGPQVVSVTTSGTLAFAAVAAGGGSCWMVRFDAAPADGSSPLVWYIDQTEPCTASAVASLPVPTDGSGTTPGDPVTL